MEKNITKIGNSRAVILPRRLLDRYKFVDKVAVHEVEEGILLKPVHDTLTFEEKLNALRAKKAEIYKAMKQEAENPEVQAYYKNESLPDIDLEIEDQ